MLGNMMWISPKHWVPLDHNPLSRTFEDKVDLFEAVTDGWFLKVADNIINGFKNEVDNSEAIVTYDVWGNRVLGLPAAGWVVFQMTMNYFEIVACFKCGMYQNDRKRAFNKRRFRKGFIDIFFTIASNDENLIFLKRLLKHKIFKHLWIFRNSLYHAGDIHSHITISGDFQFPIHYSADYDLLLINPKLWIPMLRQHLKIYVKELLESDEDSEIRTNFELAYTDRYTAKKTI